MDNDSKEFMDNQKAEKAYEFEGLNRNEEEKEDLYKIMLKDSFWGDELDEIKALDEFNAIDKIEETPKQKEIIVHDDIDLEKNKSIKANKTETKASSIQDYNRVLDEKQQEVLSEKVKNMGTTYILGKLTGEDLIDRNGNLMARKNTPISEELIELVYKEGKLSELIVNMIFPEESE